MRRDDHKERGVTGEACQGSGLQSMSGLQPFLSPAHSSEGWAKGTPGAKKCVLLVAKKPWRVSQVRHLCSGVPMAEEYTHAHGDVSQERHWPFPAGDFMSFRNLNV